MFGGHRLRASGNIKHLIFRVTSQNHVIGGSCNFMKGSSILHVTISQSLVAVGGREVVVEI